MFDHSISDLLQPVSSDEFLPPISRWTRLGGSFLLGTVGGTIALATLIKYNVIVKAPGAVRPAGETRVVQSAHAGTVERIFVKENQVVQAGEAIAQLNESQFQTQKNQLTNSIQTQQQELQQLTAQIGELERQIAAETQLTDRTLAADQAELRRNQRDYQDRQVTTQADVQEAEAALELAQQEWQRFQRLANTGAISQLQIEEKTAALKAARARVDHARAGLNPNADNVKAGDAIAQLVPSSAPLMIKARVPAQEISKVNVCKQKQVSDCLEGKVQLRIAAYPYPDYGTLNAAVRAIAPDVTTPQNTSEGATTPYYEVTIQPERAELIKGDRSYPLQAGMDVAADIIAHEETLFTFILRKVRLLTDR